MHLPHFGFFSRLLPNFLEQAIGELPLRLLLAHGRPAGFFDSIVPPLLARFRDAPLRLPSALYGKESKTVRWRYRRTVAINE
jgi:hypothetical protein